MERRRIELKPGQVVLNDTLWTVTIRLLNDPADSPWTIPPRHEWMSIPGGEYWIEPIGWPEPTPLLASTALFR